MLQIIQNTTAITLLILVLASFVSLGLGTFFISKRFLSSLMFVEHTDFGGIFSSALGILFGLILAFVTIGAWQNYNSVSQTVGQEGGAIYGIYTALDGYPLETREQGRKILRRYMEEVITQEWPKMESNQNDLPALSVLNELSKLIHQFKPSNFGELATQQEVLMLMGEYRSIRNSRVMSAKSFIDLPMFLSLGLGAFCFLFYQCLYSMKSNRLHAVMITMLSASLGLIFFLILIYSNPFIGPSKIDPTDIKLILNYANLNP